MSESRDSQLFQALVLQLHYAAWAALGKIPNPMTNKVEIDLESARVAIDTLAAVESRTTGNLDATEKQMLERVLRELRLNFVDEQRKSSGPTSEASAGASEATSPAASGAAKTKEEDATGTP